MTERRTPKTHADALRQVRDAEDSQSEDVELPLGGGLSRRHA